MDETRRDGLRTPTSHGARTSTSTEGKRGRKRSARRRTVTNRLPQRGALQLVAARPIKPPLSTKEKIERLRLIIYLYRSGVSTTEVGLAVGITKQRVLQLLRAAGVPRRTEGNHLGRRDESGRYAALGA